MLERLLIEKIENRVLVGITAFVATMLVIGWVAINENARMASFERQFNARAIERGAILFAANCSTCHGKDGRGQAGRAPGLNSPHFFGYDYFAENIRQTEALQDEQAALETERLALATELTAPTTTAERQAEIQTRLTEIGDAINGENGITARIATLTEERTALIVALQPAVDRGYPLVIGDDGDLDYAESDFTRLGQVNWGGTLDAFIQTTLIHGRPTSASYWGGNQMVAWSQRAGGPLRDDQISDLTAFIQNWDKGADWTLEDALGVQQYAIVPGLGGGEPMADGAGTDVAAILSQVETLVGDPVRGQQVYEGRQRPQTGQIISTCSGCHSAEAVAPLTQLKWDTAISTRLQLDQFQGYTVQQYLIESIVNPGAYVVPPYGGGAMPANYGELLSVQDFADILAYIQTYSELDPYVAPEGGAEATPAAMPGSSGG